MLKEIAELGFEHVELSHGIRITLVPGILRAVREGMIKVCSTHNFCPLPTGVVQAAPNLYEPSSPDAREREQWLRHTKRSIDFAAQVGARVVVCHLGSVRYFWLNPGSRLARYLQAHPNAGRSADDPCYQRLREKCVARLRKRMPPFWSEMTTVLQEALAYAREKGVVLGLENREKFEELPLDDDFGEFLAGLGAESAAGYWHDSGHAALKEAMGLLRPQEHLEKLARSLVGFHLHDVDGEGHDHQAIGSGHVDFDRISRYWKPEHLLTIELGPRVSIKDVRASQARIEALMGPATR